MPNFINQLIKKMAKKYKPKAKTAKTPKESPFTEKHNNFSVSEYCITGKEPEEEIFNAILNDHILAMKKVREVYGKPISVSQNSGYRPYEYETSKGRSGNSQHTFKQIHPKGRGAADYTAADTSALLKLLIEHSPYVRICFYPHKNFIHCDYKGSGNRRELYEANSKGKWELVKFF